MKASLKRMLNEALAWIKEPKTIHPGGYKWDNYGNFVHTRSNTGDSWNIYDSSNRPTFTVPLENYGTRFVIVPTVGYSDLPSKSTDDATYAREWIQRMCSYGIFETSVTTVCMGMFWPNVQGIVVGQVYSGSRSNNFPNYCTFVYFSLASTTIKIFGTNNYSYYFYTK